MSHHGWGVFYYLYTIYCSRGCFCLKTPARRGLMAYFFPARFRLLVPPSPVLHNFPLPIIHLSLPRLRLQSQPTRSSAKFLFPSHTIALVGLPLILTLVFLDPSHSFFLCCQEDKKIHFCYRIDCFYFLYVTTNSNSSLSLLHTSQVMDTLPLLLIPSIRLEVCKKVRIICADSIYGF